MKFLPLAIFACSLIASVATLTCKSGFLGGRLPIVEEDGCHCCHRLVTIRPGNSGNDTIYSCVHGGSEKRWCDHVLKGEDGRRCLVESLKNLESDYQMISCFSTEDDA